ncbi:MAG: hypothetical protein D6693_00605 [Planctomycetota bacterium]|nr:MAG: hypothetical protein D6693_00605 [Planctomycetota bacterium]
MPASRSRTENWRRTLQQVCERNGGIEIAIPRPGDAAWPNASEQDDAAVNLIWRVRLLAVGNDELVIETPSTLGERIDLRDGLHLIVVFSLGQNRWMFRTRTLGRLRWKLNHHHAVGAVRLRAPERVERCQRRQFYRVSTVGLMLPRADAAPLLNTSSAIAAEKAVQTRIEILREGAVAGYVGFEPPILLPEVGPAARALLVNVGGGGAGLMAEGDAAGVFDQHRLFWVTLHLMPHLPAPLSVVCRLAHVRIDSEQRRYLGMSFEFGHHPDYKQFVVDTLCHTVNEIQRQQLRRRTDEPGADQASA